MLASCGRHYTFLIKIRENLVQHKPNPLDYFKQEDSSLVIFSSLRAQCAEGGNVIPWSCTCFNGGEGSLCLLFAILLTPTQAQTPPPMYPASLHRRNKSGGMLLPWQAPSPLAAPKGRISDHVQQSFAPGNTSIITHFFVYRWRQGQWPTSFADWITTFRNRQVSSIKWDQGPLLQHCHDPDMFFWMDIKWMLCNNIIKQKWILLQ